MTYNEIRKDYLLDQWAVIATARARRPTDFVKKDERAAKPTATCPMEPGNEHMTPPAVLLYVPSAKGITKTHDKEEKRIKDWLIRVVPNLYPAFQPPQKLTDQNEMVKDDNLWLAIGHHEVIIESPNHDEHPAVAELSQLQLVVDAYIDRLKELTAKPYVKYVCIFRNHGLEAGASLSHAHSQIIATPSVPTLVAQEMTAALQYFRKNKTCAFCDILKKERKSPRFVSENSEYLAFTPYASIYPMELWILPKEHENTPLNLTRNSRGMLAEILKKSLAGLKQLVNDPPYNYAFHLALNADSREFYHWHLEIYPKLSVWAGFELGTGMYINTMTPETAAESLRNVISA